MPEDFENFTTHSRNGYFDNIISTAIKGFMLQTGDPLGDGTGGLDMGRGVGGRDHEGSEARSPLYGSMANADLTPTDRSFSSLLSLPLLDGKHTVFGRVTKGSDVVHAIENRRPINRTDRTSISRW